MSDYNATAHSEAKIREILVAACQKGGWKTANGAYRIRRFVAIRYLANYFENLHRSTVTTMLDVLILEGKGSVVSECKDGTYYVRIPFDERI